MNYNFLLQAGLYLAALGVLSVFLGSYMAKVYSGEKTPLEKVFGGFERLVYRLCRIDADREMGWKDYAVAMLLFSGASLAGLFVLQLAQGWLPLNQGTLSGGPMGGLDAQLAYNTAGSFVSNTNWQAYGGETTMTYLTQMLGLTVQNFVSAATGMSVCAAFIRGLVRRECSSIGNYYRDMTRSVLYILLPISFILALVLVGQGVTQTLEGPVRAKTLEAVAAGEDGGNAWREIARGPVASQLVIKQLGTNGGGFFNTNSSHPFENPTPFSNYLQMLAILVISGGLCFTLGKMTGSWRQGAAVFAAMTLVFVLFCIFCVWQEQKGNPHWAGMGAAMTATEGERAQAGGNMEGKEVRFGIVSSGLFATVTTSASCGAVNSMHDSYTPLGGLVPMLLMQLGEIIYGGVGSGLTGILAFVVATVFISGLMVGRTPEYLGKKIEPFEMKMSSLIILLPPFLTLAGTAVAAVYGASSIANPGPHGFSEILYAFSSMGNNNGSAFAGLNANTPVYNLLGGTVMLLSRFGVAVPVLAMAAAFAAKKSVPKGFGTLPTDGSMFVFLLVAVILLVGALTFLPALAMGPIVDHLGMIGK